MAKKMVKVSDLQVGDVVQLEDREYYHWRVTARNDGRGYDAYIRLENGHGLEIKKIFAHDREWYDMVRKLN